MWVVELLPEIESDFSRFHRIDDPIGTMDSPRFFRLAKLLHVYGGAVSFAAAQYRREMEGTAAAPIRAAAPAPVGSDLKAIVAKASHAPGSNFPGIEYRGK